MISNEEVLKELKDLRKDMVNLNKEKNDKQNEKMNEMKNELTSMKESLNFMNEKFEMVMKELNETREENKKIKKEMAIMKEKVVAAECLISELRNEHLRDKIEISGIPCVNNENCHRVALNVLKQVSPNIEGGDIVEAYRIGSVNDKEGRPRQMRNLLVKMKENKIRNEVYRNKKKLKDIDTVKMGLSNEKKRVYVNEHLSKETKLLFSKANAIRKEKGWRFIWTDFGVIYLRRSDGSKVIKIKSEGDLDLLK